MFQFLIGLLMRRKAGAEAGVRALFANGEPGYWYDPSDFSTMFQDTAGTVPVTAVGQTVALIRDKSGRGTHGVPPSTMRPTLQVDARGNYYLMFNGSTQIVTGVFSASTLSCMVAGFYVTVSSGTQCIAGNGDLLAYVQNGTMYSYAGTYVGRSSAILATSYNLYSWISGTAGRVSVNALATSENTGTRVCTTAMYIGMRSDNTWALTGRLYGIVYRGAPSTDTQARIIERYMNTKTGVY